MSLLKPVVFDVEGDPSDRIDEIPAEITATLRHRGPLVAAAFGVRSGSGVTVVDRVRHGVPSITVSGDP